MKQKILVIIIFTVILLFAFTYISRRSKEKAETALNQGEQVSWHNIKAGESTLNQLENLGEPLEREKLDDGEILYYPTLNQYLKNEVKIEGDKVAFIKEVLYTSEDKSLKNKIDALGNSYIILYGPNSNSGVLLFAYPEIGVAYLANQYADFVFEAWYFPPSNLESLLSQPQLNDFSTEEIQRLD